MSIYHSNNVSFNAIKDSKENPLMILPCNSTWFYIKLICFVTMQFKCKIIYKDFGERDSIHKKVV